MNGPKHFASSTLNAPPANHRAGSDVGGSSSAAPTRPTAADLGFTGNAETGWSKILGGRLWRFQTLRRLDDLSPVDDLQRALLGTGDYDVVPANELMVVAETGGAVIGAFPPGGEVPEGVVVGWGGYVGGRPRIVSDFLGVRPAYRSAGLGAELKRLQAAVALERGFAEIVWTVDPLRAANARLNFGKLGATADRYEVDRYGVNFAPGLYGGLPTDRLHVTWAIADAHVQARLRGIHPGGLPGTAVRVDDADLLPYSPGIAADRTTVAIPPNIDQVLATDPDAARAWRLRVRNALRRAFADRYRVIGFVAGGETGAALVLERPSGG